ncbi:MAG: hypothetical protein J5827_03950, partial [Oscillospiraceae bacterium]|nr:hypothetical protein [Oscillospiraceae bacterium]
MKMKEGWSPDQAHTYATLVAASESVLQYLLGGISKIGGGGTKLVDKAVDKILVQVAKIDSAFARAALEFGTRLFIGRGVPEAVEESLQEVLEPVFAHFIHGDEVHIDAGNVAYAGLMGFLSAILLEGGEVYSEVTAPRGLSTVDLKNNIQGYLGADGIDYFADCTDEASVKARWRELSKQYHPDAGGNADVFATISNQHDIQEAFYKGFSKGASTETVYTGGPAEETDVNKVDLQTAAEVEQTENAGPETGAAESAAPEGRIDLKTYEQEQAEKENAASGAETVTGNTRLTEADLAGYMSAGDRQHVRNLKERQLLAGISPILIGNEDIQDFIKKSVSGEIRDDIRGYGKVGAPLAEAISEADLKINPVKANGNGLNVQDYYLELEANHLAHLKDHIEEDADGRNVPMTPEQVLRIPEYIDNATDVLSVMRHRDGGIHIQLGTKINGYSVVLELVSKGRRSLHPTSAWTMSTEDYEARFKNKKTTSVNTSHAHEVAQMDISQGGFPGTAPEAAPDVANNIPQSGGGVNTVYANGRGNIQENAPERINLQTYGQTVQARNEQNGGIVNGEQRSAQAQAADGGAGAARPDAVGAQGDVYGRGRGGEPDNAGRAGAGGVREETGRISGKDKEHRELILQRTRAVADQPNTSAEELGVRGGTADQALRILPESAWDDEIVKAEELARANGIKDFKVVLGRLAVTTKAGPVAVDDVIDAAAGTLTVRGDSATRSVTEIVEHALCHKQATQTRVRAFMDSVKERYKESAWGAMYEKYLIKWAELTDDYAGMTDSEIELYVWEEILGDAYAKVNNYGQRASVYNREALAAMDGAVRTAEQPAIADAITEGRTAEVPEARGPPRQKYALNQDFGSDFHEWIKNKTPEQRAIDGGRFFVGTTSEKLRAAGVDDYDIYWGKSKIAKIMQNAEMTDNVILQVPNVIENPIIVMDSLTVDGSIVMFGDVKTQSGKPVMVSMLLHPETKTGEVLDYGVVTSAYGRRVNNTKGLIERSNIRWVDPDKKRTSAWSKALGLQLPSASTTADSDISITVDSGKSNSKFSTIDEERAETPETRLPGVKKNETTDNIGTFDKKNPKYRYAVSDETEETERKAKPKPSTESRPIISKSDLRKEMLGIFSIPDGMRAEMGALVDEYADRMLSSGKLTQRDFDSLLNRMYANGIVDAEALPYAADARRAVVNRRIYIPERIKPEFGDDWNDFRKRAFAAGIYLTADQNDPAPDVINMTL